MNSILLAGAVLVGLPVLLHLIMKQEPKRLLFPALRFLKQKQKTNQRKMRLRHFLLLALRMLLIALFCLVLFQPTISGDLRLVNLSGEQPVAAVLIIDNSPSMGYTQNNVSRLEDARKRANEFLDDLPPGSRIAILEPNDPIGNWENSLADARKRLENFKETSGNAVPITSALPVAYQLLKTVDQEVSSSQEPLPRVVAVFSDRTTNAWESARADDLKKLRETIPDPKPIQLFVDVGAESPTNVSILSAEIRPQLLSASAPILISVTVQATGADVPSCEVSCTLDDAPVPQRVEKALRNGSPQSIIFKYDPLKPGFHKACIKIRDDNLPSDNERFLTFQVAEARKILTIAESEWDAAYWQISHRHQREFESDVIAPAAVNSLAGYEAVCLLNVPDPTVNTAAGKPLWDVLLEYVKDGGKLLIAPGDFKIAELPNYNKPAAALELLPGTLEKIKDWSLEPVPKPPDDPKAARSMDRRFGVPWKVDAPRDTTHPMLAPFNEWRLKGNVNVLRNPRLAMRYWLVGKNPDALSVVYYNDADEEAERNPAVLERNVGKGKVLMLTTRIDPQDDEATRWNNYWSTTDSAWPVVFPNLLMRYLAGSPDDAAFNFLAGSEVIVPLPAMVPGKVRKIVLEGPGISGREAFPDVSDTQRELRISRSRTNTPGWYLVRTEDKSWEYRFSINSAPEESLLQKAPGEAIETVFGPQSVIPISKELKLRDALQTKFNQPLDLFPWLLLLLLFLFVLEGVVANRFYKLGRANA